MEFSRSAGVRLLGLASRLAGPYVAVSAADEAPMGIDANMRDLFEDLFATEPIDPMTAARTAMKPQLRRRFYEAVAVLPQAAGSFAIHLDNRPIRTPARGLLALPNAALAEAVAAEWRAQAEVVDPASMPLTRLANTVVDGVIAVVPEVAAEVEKYLASDLLFYRADSPAGLIERQADHWDPILAWARETVGARFVLGEGVMFVPQPAAALAAMAAIIPREPWRLAGVHAVTTLTGSAVIALALAHRGLDVGAAWAAAHVDEDWNMEFWGRDSLALDRRQRREAEMRAAAMVLDLTL
jgi:chaperone required for assembly of F1-ATPase